MTSETQELLDTDTRALLAATLPKLPEAIFQALVADSSIRAAMGIPTGEYVRLFDRRFDRAGLLHCLRDIANAKPGRLTSADGAFEIDAARLDDDGAAILTAGTVALRFANVGTLSEDPERRMRTFEMLELAEMPPDRESAWRATIQAGALDDDLFSALETTVHQSPEATFRELLVESAHGLSFDELAPDELNHYAGLLGFADLPATLDAYRDEWQAAVANLDARRISRAISLAGASAILPTNLVLPAAQLLARDDRLALAHHLASCPDPFSKLTAAQIGSAHAEDADFRAIVDQLLPQLIDRDAPSNRGAAELFCSAYIVTTAVTSRNRTMSAWPIYARRLACVLHASHIVRTFEKHEVDTDALMRANAPTARLAQLIEAREWPFNLPAIFMANQVRPLVLIRLRQMVEGMAEEERPELWVNLVGEAIKGAMAAHDAPLLLLPGLLDAFEVAGSSLIPLPVEIFDRMIANLDAAGGDPEALLSDLFYVAVAFEPDDDQKQILSSRLPAMASTLMGESFVPIVELSLQLAARWRMPAMSQALIGEAISRAGADGFLDAGASPRLLLLGAASNADMATWALRIREFAPGFAFAAKPGAPVENLLGAIDIMREMEPELEGALASARSFSLLARDRLVVARDTQPAPIDERDIAKKDSPKKRARRKVQSPRSAKRTKSQGRGKGGKRQD